MEVDCKNCRAWHYQLLHYLQASLILTKPSGIRMESLPKHRRGAEIPLGARDLVSTKPLPSSSPDPVPESESVLPSLGAGSQTSHAQLESTRIRPGLESMKQGVGVPSTYVAGVCGGRHGLVEEDTNAPSSHQPQKQERKQIANFYTSEVMVAPGCARFEARCFMRKSYRHAVHFQKPPVTPSAPSRLQLLLSGKRAQT